MSDYSIDDEKLAELSAALRVLARRLVLDEESAEDLVQEAWLAALEQPPERVRDLTAWLRAVVRNLAVRRLERSARLREVEERAARSEQDVSAQDAIDRSSSGRLLVRTTQGLRDPYREVVFLRFFEERSVSEIATRLGRPVETVKSQLKRGLAQMRERLDREFNGDRGAWSLAFLAQFDLDSPESAARTPARVGRDLRSAAPAAQGPAPGGLSRAAWGGLALVVILASAVHFATDPGAPSPASERVADRTAQGGLVHDAVVTRTPVQPDSAGTGVAPREQDAARAFRVRVVDLGGVPASDAWVEVTGSVERWPCDEGGEVVLRLPSGGDGTPDSIGWVARAPGRAESRVVRMPTPPTVDAARGEEPLELTLRGPETVIEAKVVDEAGRPVPNASLYSFGPLVQDLPPGDGDPEGAPIEARGIGESRRQVAFDAGGEVRLEHLAQVERTYHVSAPGYALTRLVDPPAGPGMRELRFVLVRGASLRGVVRDSEGKGVAGARVWTDVGPGQDRNALETRTDGSGAFWIEGLDPGRHTLFAMDSNAGRGVACTVRDLTRGEEAHWEPTLSERPGVRLLCREPDGSPLVSSDVLLRRSGDRESGWMRAGRTDGSGRVRFHPVPAGPFEVIVVGHHMQETLQPALVVQGLEPDATEVTLTIEAQEIPSGRVEGLFLDVQGRVPVDGRLRLESIESQFHRRASLDEQGAFRFKHVPSGRYELIGRMGRLGLSHLGTVELADGDFVDLGLVQAPALLPVHLAWDGPAPSDVRLTIQSGAPIPGRDTIWRWQPVLESAPGPLPERMDLLPGFHCLIVERGDERPLERRIYLDSGPVQLQFGPTDRFVQRVRFVGEGGEDRPIDFVVARLPKGRPPAQDAALDLSLLEIVFEGGVELDGTGRATIDLTLDAGTYLLEGFLDTGATFRRRLDYSGVPTTRSELEFVVPGR